MPKLKTKSSIKKRVRVTGNGLLKGTQANKRHNMRKRSKRQLRNQRGTEILNAIETRRALQWMPYDHKSKKKRLTTYLEVVEGETSQ